MRRRAIVAVALLSVTACGHAPQTAPPETTSVAARVTTTTAPAPPNYSIVGQARRDDGKPVYDVLIDPVDVGNDGFQRDVKRVLGALATRAGGPDFSASVFDDRAVTDDRSRAQHLVATYAGARGDRPNAAAPPPHHTALVVPT